MNKPANATTYRKAAYELALAENPKIIVEVGVYEGALSRMFASIPNSHLTIVDSWAASYSAFGKIHMDKIAKSVMDWAENNNVFIYRMDSAEGAEYFEDESIDFFHTDGDHTLEGIRADIKNWFPKVKPGCIMSGDNYEAPTVAQGVDEAFPNRQLGANGRLWWIRK